MSVFLICFPPKFCPNCGYEYCWSFDQRFDFNGGASHICPNCQTRFCHVSYDGLIEAADKAGSDLPMYEGRAE